MLPELVLVWVEPGAYRRAVLEPGWAVLRANLTVAAALGRCDLTAPIAPTPTIPTVGLRDQGLRVPKPGGFPAVMHRQRLFVCTPFLNLYSLLASRALSCNKHLMYALLLIFK